jgi:hypothetical protein
MQVMGFSGAFVSLHLYSDMSLALSALQKGVQLKLAAGGLNIDLKE